MTPCFFLVFLLLPLLFFPHRVIHHVTSNHKLSHRLRLLDLTFDPSELCPKGFTFVGHSRRLPNRAPITTDACHITLFEEKLSKRFKSFQIISASCESTSGLRDGPVELRPPVEICSTGLKCHDTTSCSPIQKCKLHSTSLAGLRRGSRTTTAVRNFRSDRVLPCATLTERAKQQNSGAPFYLLGPPSPCHASQYNLAWTTAPCLPVQLTSRISSCTYG